MNTQTRRAAIQLLAALSLDPDALSESEFYGSWNEHLIDQINDDDLQEEVA